MSRYITKNCTLPPYMAFPRFLLENQNLNETAKILYTILLDRTKLSLSHMDWVDEIGRVFIYFPIKSLCEIMHKSDMSIKTALSSLEKEDLIEIIDKKVYTLEDEEDYKIEKENGVFVIKGEAVERVMRRVNIADNESLYYFQKSLEDLGVNQKLKEMGIKEGDIVKINDYELEWEE